MSKTKKSRINMLKKACSIIVTLALVVTSVNHNNLIYGSETNEELNKSANEIVITEAQKKEAKEQVEKLKKHVEDTKESKEKNREAKVIKELKKLRTSDSSTYLLSDGSRKLEIYSKDIYYKENGEYVDYDPSLKKLTKAEKKELLKKDIIVENNDSDYAYVNNAGDAKHYFPETLDENNAVILTKNNHEISFGLVIKNEVNETTLDIAENSNLEESNKADSLLCINEDNTKEVNYSQ